MSPSFVQPPSMCPGLDQPTSMLAALWTTCVGAGRPPRLVAVPTHFYKVVLTESESKSRLPFGDPKVAVGAFVMPNDQIQPDMPLTAFAVPLGMLEDVAGTHLATCCLDSSTLLAVLRCVSMLLCSDS